MTQPNLHQTPNAASDKTHTSYSLGKDDIRHREKQLVDAVRQGEAKLVDTLIEEGVNVNTLRFDQTPLMIAACYNHKNILIQLLKAGAIINETNENNEINENNNALMIAAAAGSFECLKILLEYGASINEQNKYGETALTIVALYREPKCLQLLLEHNASLDVQDNEGNTALMQAAASGSAECVKILINSNAKLDLIDDNGNDALIKSLSEGMDNYGDCSLLLINAGCMINQENKNGKTPLSIAVSYDKVNVINELIARGVNVNHCTKNNVTALWTAADKRVENLLKILLDAGANPNIGRPPLVASVDHRWYNVEFVKILLEAGADINAVDIYYGTMMLYAAIMGKPEIVKIALNAGAEINISHKTFHGLYGYNEEALMLLFAAGEECDYFKYSTIAPKTIIETRKDFSLQNICRKAIRKNLNVTNPKRDLFRLVELLPLPKPIKKFLVYDVSF